MASISAATGVGYSSSQNSTGTASEGSGTNSEFETFLKMLTTQIKNQDPLNPMEGTEFAVQLATFSGLSSRFRPTSCSVSCSRGVAAAPWASCPAGSDARSAPARRSGSTNLR
ncbi:MAG: flagellar hook capping FlgD N-terminal domain-containing protein [Paracoccus aminovorans]|nr:flagellar hook capping FlgD N-terminal domain-containing protein [Paracoccus aminovorans]